MKEKLSPQRLDPLEFWQKNHKLYPNLSKLVRVYLCPPLSSVACERAFNVAKNVNFELEFYIFYQRKIN